MLLASGLELAPRAGARLERTGLALCNLRRGLPRCFCVWVRRRRPLSRGRARGSQAQAKGLPTPRLQAPRFRHRHYVDFRERSGGRPTRPRQPVSGCPTSPLHFARCRTGVIYVTNEAQARFLCDRPELVEPRPGAAGDARVAGRPAVKRVEIAVDDQVRAGRPAIWELREAVVVQPSIGAGCPRRLAPRTCVSGEVERRRSRGPLRASNVNPRTSAGLHGLRRLLDIFKAFTAIPICSRASAVAAGPQRTCGARSPAAAGAVLLSNPCNPTGKHVEGEDLALGRHGARARLPSARYDEFCTCLFVYRSPQGCRSRRRGSRYGASIAIHILLFDGLTKNWRYPGWRVTWTSRPRPSSTRSRAVRSSTA